MSKHTFKNVFEFGIKIETADKQHRRASPALNNEGEGLRWSVGCEWSCWGLLLFSFPMPCCLLAYRGCYCYCCGGSLFFSCIISDRLRNYLDSVTLVVMISVFVICC